MGGKSIRTIDEIAKAFASDSNEQGRMADAIRQAFEECPPLADTDLRTVLKAQDPGAMYLREVWATGTTNGGREFEIAQVGPDLVLTIGRFGEDQAREVYEIRATDLVPAWLRAVGHG